MIVKHWRQEWLFENSIFYDYNGFNDWKLKILLGQVKGQWTQKVYEVDDKPRYQVVPAGFISMVVISGTIQPMRLYQEENIPSGVTTISPKEPTI